MHSHHYLRLRNLTGKSLAWLKCMSPIPQHGTDAGSICGLNVRTNHSACSLGQKVDRNTGQYFSLHNHIRLMWCYYNTYWNSLFFVGTLGRTMAFLKKQNKKTFTYFHTIWQQQLQGRRHSELSLIQRSTESNNCAAEAQEQRHRKTQFPFWTGFWRRAGGQWTTTTVHWRWPCLCETGGRGDR